MVEFSVIIPCYNAAPYVAAAINSCLAQTVRDVEIIVVDDGSTDRSGEIVAGMAARDERILVVRQENRGLGAARNAGLKVATGKFVNFLDADDWLEPEKLAMQGAVLRERPEVGIVLCYGVGVDAENTVCWGNITDVTRFGGHPPLFHVLFTGAGAFPPMVPLVRRELAAKVGGFDEDRNASGWADTAFWMRIALTGADYHIVESPLARYRVLSTSMSSDRRAMERAGETIYAKLMSDYPFESARALRTVQCRVSGLQATLRDLQAALDLEVAKQASLAESLRAAHALSRRMFVALLSHASGADGGRPLWIWGAGAAGRRDLRLLRAAGLCVEAFVDSNPAKAGMQMEGVPILGPEALHPGAAAKPFVLVASLYGTVISERLEALGWRQNRDYHVSEFAAADVDTEAVSQQPAATHQTT